MQAIDEATGALGRNLTSLALLVANSPTFRAKVAAESEAEAQSRVYFPDLESEDQTLADIEGKRPFALVFCAGYRWAKVSGGAQHRLLPSGELGLRLSDFQRSPSDLRRSFLDFTNFVDGVIAEVAEMAATDDRCCITSIEQVLPAMRSPTNEVEVPPYWWTEFSVAWDPFGGGRS